MFLSSSRPSLSLSFLKKASFRAFAWFWHILRKWALLKHALIRMGFPRDLHKGLENFQSFFAVTIPNESQLVLSLAMHEINGGRKQGQESLM